MASRRAESNHHQQEAGSPGRGRILLAIFLRSRELAEIITVVSVPHNDESAVCRGNSSHQCVAIAWFLDCYDAHSLTLSDGLRRIGAAIVRHQNFTRNVVLAESSSSFLNACRQSILLIKAGDNY